MEELLDRFKNTPYGLKIALVLILGSSYNLYEYFVETPMLEEKLATSEQDRDGAKAQYSKAKADAEKLYKLEVELKTIREQLSKAKKYLPDEVHIDEILHTTARFCKRYQVSLDSFAPLPEEPSTNEARYSVKPVSIGLTGRFVDIARFFDSMVHLQSIVHVRNILLQKAEGEKDNDGVVDLFRLTPEQRQRYAERNTKVKATADLLLFKSEV